MKVLKDNFTLYKASDTNNKRYPRKFVCEKCGSELEYDKSDLRFLDYGCSYLDCPLCEHENYIEDEDVLILTKDNVEFPTHFSHHSKEKGAVDTCNNNLVKESIQKAIEYFRTNKKEFAYYHGTGNTMVIVFRMAGDDDYEVLVAEDYYNTYIPFEKIDY